MHYDITYMIANEWTSCTQAGTLAKGNNTNGRVPSELAALSSHVSLICLHFLSIRIGGRAYVGT